MMALCRGHAKLSETLPLISQIRDSIECAKVIWDREITKTREAEGFMEDFEEFESIVKPRIDEGTSSVDEKCWPDWAQVDDIGQKIC